MSADGSISIEWGDGEYTFRLAIGQMRELFELVNRPRVAIGAAPIGPGALLRNLQTVDAWPQDVREIVRLGLIGGGMKPDRALVLIKRFVEPPGMLLAATVLAFKVLEAAMMPTDTDEPVGKDGPAAETEQPATGSVSQRSTASALQ